MKTCFKFNKPNIKVLRVLILPIIAVTVAPLSFILWFISLGSINTSECIMDILDWVGDEL